MYKGYFGPYYLALFSSLYTIDIVKLIWGNYMEKKEIDDDQITKATGGNDPEDFGWSHKQYNSEDDRDKKGWLKPIGQNNNTSNN